MIHKIDLECSRCGKKNPDSIAYIPSLGEVCLDCYMEYAHMLAQARSYDCSPTGFT